MKYAHILRAAAQTPWAIVPEKLAAIRELLLYRASGERFTADEVEERIGARTQRTRPSSPAGTAVIPIHGVIAPRAAMFNSISGGSGTGLDAFTDQLRAAAAEPSIDRIVLDVDSPGGTVDLVPETAAEIRAARSAKPVIAVANTFAASAAYWLASQADELVITPSGEVGSIGVFCAHDDISGLLEQQGVKTTLVSAGKYKTELNPFEPLTEEARGALQESVDEFYGMFVRDVAKGRGVSVESVRGGFGEGRMVTARNAVKAGMADRVDTLDSVLGRGARRSGVVAAATVQLRREAATSGNLSVDANGQLVWTTAGSSTGAVLAAFPATDPESTPDPDVWADADQLIDVLTRTPYENPATSR